MKKIFALLAVTAITMSFTFQTEKHYQLGNDVNLSSFIGADKQRFNMDGEFFNFADKLVANYLAQNLTTEPKFGNYFDMYRQYAGYTDASGKKYALVNAFTVMPESIKPTDLTSGLITKKAGASFTIKVDFTTYQCSDFVLNAK